MNKIIYCILLGMGFGLVPMYLTENSPKHIRGSLGVLHQLGVTIGILLSQIFGLEELLGKYKCSFIQAISTTVSTVNLLR